MQHLVLHRSRIEKDHWKPAYPEPALTGDCAFPEPGLGDTRSSRGLLQLGIEPSDARLLFCWETCSVGLVLSCTGLLTLLLAFEVPATGLVTSFARLDRRLLSTTTSMTFGWLSGCLISPPWEHPTCHSDE